MNKNEYLKQFDVQIRESTKKIRVQENLKAYCGGYNLKVSHVNDKLLKLKARKCVLEMVKVYLDIYWKQD